MTVFSRSLPGRFASLFAVPLLFAGMIGTICAAEPPRKKLIEVGWDMPDPAFLRAHYAEMERSAPFDGLHFRVMAKTPKKEVADSLKIWDNTPWEYSWFEQSVTDLKACKLKKFTDNWLRVDATPGTVAWDDDDGWKTLADKLAICARIAKAGGAKGVCLDLEGYGVKAFRFDPAKQKCFAEAEKLARKRGAEAMRAMAREFPDQTLFTYWLNSINAKSGRVAKPAEVLEPETYGLQPAFINGLLDEAPAEMTLVDGCEDGYFKDGPLEYQQAAADMRQWHGPASRLVAAENRKKWRGQVQASFGFYLDMYLNPEDNVFYFPPLDGSRLRRLARNLAAAQDAADEYVWVYGEQCNWWGTSEMFHSPRESLKATVGKGRRWEAAMPGLTDVLRAARDPDGVAWEGVAGRKANGSLVNLARNGDFATEGEKGRLIDWDDWQDDGSNGTFARDAATGAGSAKATGVKNGCLLQRHAVTPGERYAVQALCKLEGASHATVLVRWKTPKGDWVRWDADVALSAADARDGWSRFHGVVAVPDNARQLVILMAVSRQTGEKDVCWFDDIELYSLPAPTFPDDGNQR